ncbi:TetR/AcrR family transcriptional regulator [Micromonospora deserti]|uniref:TetR/AcrR family transcriptional regulator n=1 Tax=Micromonospora deserti TaxID=2070366 RepID=UPI001314B6ED|nr:TetR/AcrR family transcriptional regulator [Micromonospora deserti]
MTADLITAAALKVGDREGVKAMSMRRIAAELGCDPMSLYRHFPDRQALLDAVADLALADARDPDPGESWEARLVAVLTSIRSAALRHPGIAAHIAGRPPLQRHGRRLAAAIIGALAEAGLPPADVIRATQALIAYLAAALAMSLQAGEPDARWRELRAAIAALPDALPDDALPVTGSDDQFGYGLGLLIAGIRVEAEHGRER